MALFSTETSSCWFLYVSALVFEAVLVMLLDQRGLWDYRLCWEKLVFSSRVRVTVLIVSECSDVAFNLGDRRLYWCNRRLWLCGIRCKHLFVHYTIEASLLVETALLSLVHWRRLYRHGWQ